MDSKLKKMHHVVNKNTQLSLIEIENAEIQEPYTKTENLFLTISPSHNNISDIEGTASETEFGSSHDSDTKSYIELNSYIHNKQISDSTQKHPVHQKWTGLTLNELLEELEDVHNADLPSNIEIILIPPENEVVTDEDLGDEDNLSINNLPRSQINTIAELNYDIKQQDTEIQDPEDNIPLSEIRTKLKKT
ncbi:hypothetical protein RN001_001555, partial [Aquatica leii]